MWGIWSDDLKHLSQQKTENKEIWNGANYSDVFEN